MHLNELKPAKNSKKNAKRVGRGIGSGKGKTCGRGHKGQTARSGYSKKIGFEGGQLPLQRRLPKFGFASLTALKRAEIRLSDLQQMKSEVVTLQSLKDEKVIKCHIEQVKIILSGKLDKPITVKGLKITAGARKAVEKAGGKIE